MKERHFVCTEHQIQPDFGVWHLLIAWVCRQPADGKLACFANTPSGPLFTLGGGEVVTRIVVAGWLGLLVVVSPLAVELG